MLRKGAAIKMTLKQEEEGFVLSGSISSDDPKIVPVDEEIPVTKLFGDKAIELNLKAVLGKGREHAKWSPAHAYLKEGDKDEVMLVLEPYGQLDAKEVFNKALDILVEKIDELEAKL